MKIVIPATGWVSENLADSGSGDFIPGLPTAEVTMPVRIKGVSDLVTAHVTLERQANKRVVVLGVQACRVIDGEEQPPEWDLSHWKWELQ